MTYLPLDIASLAARTAHLRIGSDLQYVPEVDSTNRVARDLVPGTWRDGTVVLCEVQHAGRGRRGRTWVAPVGSSLLLSLVLWPNVPVQPQDVVMMAALAVADAVSLAVQRPAQLKWPNDILVGGRKVCGILAEADRQHGRTRFIVGIGLNVNVDPATVPGIPADAGSLSQIVGHQLRREDVAEALFLALDMWYRCLTRDAESLFSAWAERVCTPGTQATVCQDGRTWQGTVEGVRRDGGLVVRDIQGADQIVYAADVSVREARGFTGR